MPLFTALGLDHGRSIMHKLAEKVSQQRWRLGFLHCRENQPFEQALCYFWKLRCNPQNPIVGFQHTTIHDLDLRYSRYDGSTGVDFYPDFICANSEVHYSLLFKRGWPSAQIRRVEAIRYSRLLERTKTKPSIASTAPKDGAGDHEMQKASANLWRLL